MFGNKLINTNAGGGCTDTVDNYNPFPDGGGVALYQLNGDATDESGNYNGTASNVTWGGAGEFGTSGAFNGSNSGINLPSSLNTSVIDATGAFTISMWINANDISTIQYLFCSNTVNNVEIGINSNSQGVGKIVWTIYNTSYSYLVSTVTITINTWYNIAVTYNNGSSELFINGVSQGTSIKTLLESSIEPTLGYRNTGGPVRFNGSIDQVRIFNRALRPYEVEALQTEVYCTPTIVPSEHFNTVLYTGTNSLLPITGLGFQPDLVWIKNRTNISAGHHSWIDSVRGKNSQLFSNLTNAENTFTDQLDSFDSDGFTVGTGFIGTEAGRITNVSGTDYVAWNWKAGGAAVSNTDGTITSQVSANVEAGFSVVSYTGNGANGTVGHGLGVTPNIVLSKRRIGGTSAWSFNGNVGGLVYGSNKLTLETTNPIAADTNEILAANSNNFTAGTSTAAGASGSTYIAYCFAEVEGFSSFGSYVGNGTTSGPTVVTGFEPAFVMIKRATGGVGVWVMLDNKRNITNPRNSSLYANTSAQEDTGSTSGFYPMNFYENGFEPIQNTGDYNASGGKYIYMAFAADPTTVEPTLADSFNTVLYEGNETTNKSITGVGFQPDFVWIKNRDNVSNNALFDSLRGQYKFLSSNSTASEQTYTDTLASFNSDGFTVNQSSAVNYMSMVAWNWKGAEIPAINSNGSIKSVVSANPAAGFSVVSWNGSSSNGTLGHGLGSAPKMIIVKNRSVAIDWTVYSESIGNTSHLYLNSTNAAAGGNFFWNATSPTNSVFSVSSDSNVNNSLYSYISYCFAEVAGFSKFGSYTGTGAVGNYVATGFEPAFVMVKASNTTEPWFMLDNKRDPNNPRDNRLMADSSAAESDGSVHTMDFNSLGFTLNGTVANGTNGSGFTYIYMAFANQF